MSDDELRQAILDYLRKQGRAQVYSVKAALHAHRSAEFDRIWEELLRVGDVEVCEGYHPNYYLAMYRVRVQPRLL